MAGAWIGRGRPSLVLVRNDLGSGAVDDADAFTVSRSFQGGGQRSRFEGTGAPAIWLSSSDRCLFADCRVSFFACSSVQRPSTRWHST